MGSAKDKLAIGRELACRKMPYCADYFYSFTPVEVPGMEKRIGAAFAVTQTMVIMYDPDVILNKWSVDDICTGFAHELGHILGNHIQRAHAWGFKPQSDEARIWNDAGDITIGDTLEEAGFILLDTDLTSTNMKVPKNLTVDELYKILKDRGYERKCKQCGSGSGNPLDGEEEMVPQSHPAHRTPEEVERHRKDAGNAIKAYAAQNGPGSVPGGMELWADLAVEESKISWGTQFDEAARNAAETVAGAVDYAYSGISHIQGSIGFGVGVPILPVLEAPVVDVVIALDVSASMCRKELADAVSEIKGIMDTISGSIKLLVVDTEVKSVSECRDIDDVLSKCVKGGGTSFLPIFSKIREDRMDPGILVVVTDGGGVAPLEHPGFETIWLLVGDRKVHPSFGEWSNKQGWGTVIEVD